MHFLEESSLFPIIKTTFLEEKAAFPVGRKRVFPWENRQFPKSTHAVKSAAAVAALVASMFRVAPQTAPL